LLSDPGVDMLLAIFVPQAITPVNDVARNVIAAAQSADKPVVCCLVGGESITEAIRILNEHDVPFYQDRCVTRPYGLGQILPPSRCLI